MLGEESFHHLSLYGVTGSLAVSLYRAALCRYVWIVRIRMHVCRGGLEATKKLFNAFLVAKRRHVYYVARYVSCIYICMIPVVYHRTSITHLIAILSMHNKPKKPIPLPLTLSRSASLKWQANQRRSG